MVAAGKSSGDGKVTITRAEPTNGIAYELDSLMGSDLAAGLANLKRRAEPPR